MLIFLSQSCATVVWPTVLCHLKILPLLNMKSCFFPSLLKPFAISTCDPWTCSSVCARVPALRHIHCYLALWKNRSICDCLQEPKLCFYTEPGDQPTGIIRTKAMARKKSKQQGVGAKDLVSGQQQSKKPGDAGAAAAAGGGAGGGGDAGASRTNQVANANTYIQQHTSSSRFALLATWFWMIFTDPISWALLHVQLFVFSRLFCVL